MLFFPKKLVCVDSKDLELNIGRVWVNPCLVKISLKSIDKFKIRPVMYERYVRKLWME